MTLQEPVPETNDEVASSFATVVDDVETNTKDGVPFANARPLTDSLDFNLTAAPQPDVAQYGDPSQPSTAMAGSASASAYPSMEEMQLQQQLSKRKRQKQIIIAISIAISGGFLLYNILGNDGIWNSDDDVSSCIGC